MFQSPRLNEYIRDLRILKDASLSPLFEVLYMMDETLGGFSKHTSKCGYHKLGKNGGINFCDCGSDAIKELYREIEIYLCEELDETNE